MKTLILAAVAASMSLTAPVFADGHLNGQLNSPDNFSFDVSAMMERLNAGAFETDADQSVFDRVTFTDSYLETDVVLDSCDGVCVEDGDDNVAVSANMGLLDHNQTAIGLWDDDGSSETIVADRIQHDMSFSYGFWQACPGGCDD